MTDMIPDVGKLLFGMTSDDLLKLPPGTRNQVQHTIAEFEKLDNREKLAALAMIAQSGPAGPEIEKCGTCGGTLIRTEVTTYGRCSHGGPAA